MLARAKINLYLHVVGRRPDGFHLLDSLVVFAEAGDEIDVAPADDLSLTIVGPFAGKLTADEDNLVLRAARGLRDLAGIAAGAAITLTKNLPVASGIGGGSADAGQCAGDEDDGRRGHVSAPGQTVVEWLHCDCCPTKAVACRAA